MSETTVAAAGNIFKKIWERIAGRYKKLTETIDKLSDNISELHTTIDNMNNKMTSLSNGIDAVNTRLNLNTRSLTMSVNDITKSVDSINVRLDTNTKTIQEQAKKIDLQSDKLGKIEVGLQLELFHSLQSLHDKYCNRSPSGWATSIEKADAKRFYDQIHVLGQDGWSKRYWDDIYGLPETRPRS